LQELYRSRDSMLHAMDARVKVLFTLAFIVSLSLSPHGAWPAFILFFSLSLSMALTSRIGLTIIFKRSLLALPFVLAALPLVFIGSEPRYILEWFPAVSLYYSPAGMERFLSIAIKSWISVQAAILLSATTRFPDLLAALRQLGVPRLLVAVTGLMWRYLFVMFEEVTRLLRARSSRSATPVSGGKTGGSLLWRARVAGGMAGSLFLRSLERSDRVYAAMLARGYSGDPPVFAATPLTGTDRRILIFGAVILAAILFFALLTGA
jgi:cobalt/nickel transport system permease protein